MMDIKYENISLIGMELFRKNNSTFLKSNLSPIMSKIFKAANSPHIQDTDSEYYMKSGSIPNRVFYIYSDQLSEKDPEKIYDIVYFNNEPCIWFYSSNAINMIDKDPVVTIYDIYYHLQSMFMNKCHTFTIDFMNTEYFIVRIVMCINLIIFLNETYGALDVEKCKKEIIEKYLDDYTEESAIAFIEDVCENCTSKDYFNNREYLDSYLLLKERPTLQSI